MSETSFSMADLRNMIRSIHPDLKDAKLELLTITSPEGIKNKTATLVFNFGVDGYEWE